jgi:hypothetical protein
MKPCSLSRRTLLRGWGASLALPALEIMRLPKSRAAESGAPARLLTLFQPNGVYPNAWDVTDEPGDGGSFSLSPILEPMRPFLGDFSVISGLDNTGSGHVQLTGAFLTGVPIRNGRCAESLDQLVARSIGHRTPLPSLVLGTEPPRQGNASGEPISLANTVSWSSENTRIFPEIHPQAAFDRLFRGSGGPGAMRRKSVLDLVRDDAKSLLARASGPDRQKLEEYLDSVRGVEIRLEKIVNPPSRDWVPPSPPGPAEMARPESDLPETRQEHLRLMMDLMVLAFWTDTTRVGTLMTAHGFSRQSFAFLPGVSSDHHGMSHHKNKPETIAEYTRVCGWFIEQFAYLLGKLKSIDEGGATLLDRSVVLYGCAMKDGNGHVRNDLPLLLAGKGGGRLKPGRHINAPAGTPHANLLLTLAQSMGVETESFNGVSTGTVAI